MTNEKRQQEIDYLQNEINAMSEQISNHVIYKGHYADDASLQKKINKSLNRIDLLNARIRMASR